MVWNWFSGFSLQSSHSLFQNNERCGLTMWTINDNDSAVPVCVWAEVKHRGSAHLFEVCWATFSKLLHSCVSSYCTITYLQQIKLELNPTPAHSHPQLAHIRTAMWTDCVDCRGAIFSSRPLPSCNFIICLLLPLSSPLLFSHSVLLFCVWHFDL